MSQRTACGFLGSCYYLRHFQNLNAPGENMKVATFDADKGIIRIELFAEQAPKTVEL